MNSQIATFYLAFSLMFCEDVFPTNAIVYNINLLDK